MLEEKIDVCRSRKEIDVDKNSEDLINKNTQTHAVPNRTVSIIA